jgi:hypothetical protein
MSTAFRVGRPVLYLYALLAVALSAALLLQSRARGPRELSLWLAAYGGLALLSFWRPRWSPLVAGAMAFLLGIVKTHRAGPNLDLGLSLIAFSIGAFILDRVRRGDRRPTTDPAGLALMLVAVWSLVSLAFTIARVRAFTPAPGFDYHVYPFNPLRFSSDEAIIRTVIGATAMFIWFGLYEYGRSVEIPRRVLRGVVTLLLLLNAGALVVQQHVDPFFLLHAGRPIGRFNGVTSYSYALGDAVLALFLLLPAWGSSRGLPGLLTAGNLLLLAHAVAASGSRTALLCILLVAVLWTALRVWRLSGTRPRLAVGGSLTVVGLGLALAGWAYLGTPADQVSPIGRLKFGIERDGVLGHVVVTRLSSYPLIARVLAAYPLTGVGVGLYPGEVSKQHALLLPDLEMPEPYLLSSFAPNQFLNTGVELGLPALVALVGVFAYAGASVLRRRGEGRSADVAVGLLGLAAALQVGPSLYTSEAVVFFWLLIGLAAGGGPSPVRERNGGDSTRATMLLIAGAGVVGIGAQLLALPSLAVDSQWKRLRWPLNLGLQRPEEGGRWTRPQATFTVDPPGRELRLRWHVGDRAAPEYRARVSFYVDGDLVEQSLVSPGPVRQSVLPLPEVRGPKRISVRVEPPFLPGERLGRDDPRRLGIFLHEQKPDATQSASR